MHIVYLYPVICFRYSSIPMIPEISCTYTLIKYLSLERTVLELYSQFIISNKKYIFFLRQCDAMSL